MFKRKKIFVFLFLFFSIISNIYYTISLGNPQSISLLYVENLTDRGPDDLEARVAKSFEDNIVKYPDVELISSKEFEDRAKKAGLAKAIEYINLLDNTNLSRLGRMMKVDNLIYINIVNYDEVLTKNKSLVFISISATSILSSTEEHYVYNAISKIELLERKSGNKARNSAILEVINSVISQILKKEYIQQNVLVDLVGNKNSLLFHFPKANHIPDKNNSVILKDIEDARSQGYSPCPVCFPQLVPSTENASQLELMLSSEASGLIEYYYRKLYDEKINNRINKIGQQIVKASPRQNLRFIFTVLNSDEINAFAAGSGFVYITKGLLDIIESDDELAGVLSHEIAHNIKEHIVRQYKRGTNLSILGAVLSGGQFNIGVEFVKSLLMYGYERKYEREADNLAIIYSIRAGFNPQGYILVLKKLLELEKTQPSKLEVYFRSHPPIAERIKRCEEFLEDYNKLLNKLKEETQ